MLKRGFLVLLAVLAMLAGVCGAGWAEQPRAEKVVYLQLAADVYLPDQKAPAPLVFFVHNGFANKEGWGDYPQELAAQGFLTVALNWDDWKMYDLEKAIGYTLDKYSDRIDKNRVAFVGGCHGGLKCLNLLGYKDLKYKIATMVLLSVSEEDPGTIQGLQNPHPPLLVFYSSKDRLGEYYQKVNKKVAEEMITQPKTVVALDATAHGNELLVDPAMQSVVRAKITAWLQDYLK